jgi:4-alpha-glucanotransferase
MRSPGIRWRCWWIMAELPERLERLRIACGIAPGFTDFRGQTYALSEVSLRALLVALGYDAGDPDGLAAASEALDEAGWMRVLDRIVVLRGSRRVPFTVLAPLLPSIAWRVETEQGDTLRGGFDPATLPVLEERGLRGLWYVRLALDLPELPLGYHRLWLEKADGTPLGSTRLVVAPERCHEPEAIQAGVRLWGPAIQLYTLRSARNWGIGDFTDLKGFVTAAAGLGADVVGLNPLHALFPADPVKCGPYSPSSRRFLNVLYIDPEAVPEFVQSHELRREVGLPEFQARLAALRASAFVDYEGVASCKLEVLHALYRWFRDRGSRERRFEFDQFRKKHGQELEKYALFHALQDHFKAAGNAGGWPGWPEAYQDPGGAAACAFMAAEPEQVEFHCWLQWLAAEQLAAAAGAARAAGMRLGLYFDLAVGPDGGGAETWGESGLFPPGATVGAPPDPLALQGQDWGIPPFHPQALRERDYAPFIGLLRANMPPGGALRIDHVMMLFRLWWVPRGAPSSAGGYVHYRLDEMMALVALESVRQRCLVIGEDLGTVPPEVRDAMSAHGVYSYRVLFFERDASGGFRPPGDYPRESLATLSTHDLPPLPSFWAGTDIDLRERLSLYPDPVQAEQERVSRAEARVRLLAWLEAEGLAPAGLSGDDDSLVAGWRMVPALQRCLARSRAGLLMVQPEDWLGMDTPVNVPGTHREYPNWARKLNTEWPDFMARPALRKLGQALSEARRQGPA